MSTFYVGSIICIIYLSLYIWLQQRRIRRKEQEFDAEKLVNRDASFHGRTKSLESIGEVQLRNSNRASRVTARFRSSLPTIFSGSETNCLNNAYSGHIPAVTYMSSVEAALPSFYLRLGTVCKYLQAFLIGAELFGPVHFYQG